MKGLIATSLRLFINCFLVRHINQWESKNKMTFVSIVIAAFVFPTPARSLSILGHLLQNVGTNILKVSYRIKTNGLVDDKAQPKGDGEDSERYR